MKRLLSNENQNHLCVGSPRCRPDTGFHEHALSFTGENTDRKETLSFLKTKSPEVLVVGAGINGAGVFRDLAVNGVDVLLVERGDFCSGASAGPAQVAQSGFRYFEQGKFRLALEMALERNRMLENAPHLVRSFPRVLPVFNLFPGLQGERSALATRLGLFLNDVFARSQGMVPLHKFDGRGKSMRKFPALSPDIQYTATHYEGQVLSPERFTVELVLDAEAEGSHARALNYVSLQGSQGQAVMLKDELSGLTYSIQPKLIINAAGGWIDQVNTRLGFSTSYCAGMQGPCLMLDHPELRAAIGNSGFFFENKQGRSLSILPFYERVVIGANDLFDEDPDRACYSEAEIEALIGLVAHIFPTVKLSGEHIVFRSMSTCPPEFRRAKADAPELQTPAIKKDSLSAIPVYSMLDVHWTIFRAFAEQAADLALASLRKPRKANTRSLPVGGGKDYPIVSLARIEFIKKIAIESAMGGLRPKKLFERYGTRALEVTRYLKAAHDEPLKSNPDWSRREVEFLVEREKALHVDDILLRRSSLVYQGQVSLPLVGELTGILAGLLGWSPEQEQAELRRTLSILKERHGVESD